jgi:hypothetical protein
MKHFTQQWWQSGCEDAPAVFERYESYLASVRSQLPPDLVALEADHTLHDSEVKSIVSNFETRTVVIVLNGWTRELEHRVAYTLTFTGVANFDQVLPQQEYVESELGDLGYWECELLTPEVEVRMLFVSNAEFRIVFNGFSFEHHRRDA